MRDPVADIPRHDPAQTPAVPTAALYGQIDPDLRWSDIERFASDSRLPVLVKGILTAEDAELAVAHGAAGVVVSNHGGRQLDTVLSGADALAPIVDAVGGRIDVLVDGGIRRGTDVVKALALGARAVLVGRPADWGLAVDGADGAQRVLETLLAEFDNALALVGCPRAAELDASFVTRAGRGRERPPVDAASSSPGSPATSARCSPPGCARRPHRAGLRPLARARRARRSGGRRRRRHGPGTGRGAGRRRRRLLPDPLAWSRPARGRSPPASAAAAERFAAGGAAAGVQRIVYLGGIAPPDGAALGAPGQPAGGGGHPARGRARLGRAARVDRDRRPLAVVSLPGAPGRAAAGARLPGLADQPHRPDRRARHGRGARPLQPPPSR